LATIGVVTLWSRLFPALRQVDRLTQRESSLAVEAEEPEPERNLM
jgi:hypothetical protein